MMTIVRDRELCSEVAKSLVAAGNGVDVQERADAYVLSILVLMRCGERRGALADGAR